MKKVLTILALGMVLPAQSFAISYYQNKGGSVTKIDAGAFSSCSTIIYRSSAKDELDADHKRALVAAMLKGEAINDLAAANAALKKTEGACTYGTDSEKFQ